MWFYFNHNLIGYMFLANGNMFLVNGKPFINKSHISCGFLDMLDAFLKQLKLEINYQESLQSK